MLINEVELANIQSKSGITVKELSRLTGISRSQLSNIRNGRETRPLTARRIADALGVDLSQIVKNESRKE